MFEIINLILISYSFLSYPFVQMVLSCNSPTLKNDIIDLEGFGIYPTLIKFALTELKL